MPHRSSAAHRPSLVRLLLALAASVAGCEMFETPERPPQPAIVFVLNGTADALRLELDGELVVPESPAAEFSPLLYADSRAPITISPVTGSALAGSATIRLARDPYAEERLTFVRVLPTAGGTLDAVELPMPAGLPATGTARFRFVNLSPSSGTVDLWGYRSVTRTVFRLASGIAYGGASEVQLAPSGVYNLLVAPATPPVEGEAPPAGLPSAPTWLLPGQRDLLFVLFERADASIRLAASPLLQPRPGPDTACPYPCGLPTGPGALRTP